MTDRRQVPIQMQGATQPKTPPGERILVALAALALLSGALIVAGNLLRQDEVASVASASPQATERPSRTPRPTLAPTPTPAPIELVLEPAAVPTVEAAPTRFSGWIRATVKLQILAAPQLDAAPIGVLPAGEVTYAYEDQAAVGEEGWLSVNWRIDQGGWVATRSGGADIVERHPEPPYSYSGGIWNLAAGPRGFIGFGSQTWSTSAGNRPEIMIHSADGARWQVASAPPSPALSPITAAWGPTGWLLMSNSLDSRTWLSSSVDGSQWTTLGTLRASNAAYPQGLAASDAGYLLAAGPALGDRPPSLWFSVDGVNWHEVHPGLSMDQYVIGGTTGGFYAWAPAGYPPQAAFSADGRTWSRVTGGPASLNFPPVVVGDRWFAIETYGATGLPLAAPRAWLGRVSGGDLSWQLMAGAAASFADALVTALVSTGDEAIAFGSDLTTGAARTWASTGSDWAGSELPAAFGGFNNVAAAGSTGVAAVGLGRSTLGEDPVIWHRSASGDWQPESDPVIAPLPEPSLADCAPLPRDALAFVLLDYTTRAFCYGDATISFRGWSTPCQMYCDGEYGGGTYEPAWLAAASANRLFLSLAGFSTNASIQAILPPALATSPPAAWLDTWLEVRGHFDDAAALTCRYTPSPGEAPYYRMAESTVNACRQQFVVSSLKVVSGP